MAVCEGPPAVLGTIAVDTESSIPLYRQLFDALRDSILAGLLKPGVRLPSTRNLAQDLGVGRNTVIAAYDQLIAEGYLEARTGAGTRVATITPDALSRVSAERGTSLQGAAASPSVALSARGELLAGTERLGSDPSQSAFQPGLPALDEFPFAVWSRLVAHRTAHPLIDTLGYYHIGGYQPLREAIASYLGAARAVQCEPDQIIIVTGAQAALDLTVRMMSDPGDRVLIEEPGYLGARGAFLAAGADLQPVTVDHDGIDISQAPSSATGAKLVYVTPSYQYPLGVTMSLQRRLQLLDWAHANDAWIVEDDYDSEYRYRGYPLSALHGLDHGQRVVYMGTFSKTMFPALRLAYIVVPQALSSAFRQAVRHTGQDSPLIEQAALTDFMNEGHYASHLRRMRRLYAERQQRLIDYASSIASEVIELQPSDAGMQLVARLQSGYEEESLVDALRNAGLKLNGLGSYYIGPVQQRGLYLGYAGVTDAHMREGLEQLVSVARQMKTKV